ncbi:MAG: fibrillarin-like rRNA/tRNA 2'-O-methyltransferase [Candidatus Hadarchaeales archaeon]
MRVEVEERFPGVYWLRFPEGKKLATRNLLPGERVYGEELVRVDGTEYRVWDPYRSKLSSALHLGLKEMPVGRGSRVLYLGAASGTTASHLSDIVGERGVIWCVELSFRPMRDLLPLCEKRKNMIPILSDARYPSSYRFLLEEADVIYQDVAQPDQTEILKRNLIYLRPGGWVLFFLKAKSIDVTKSVKEVFREEREKLGEEMKLVDFKLLEPYEKDHVLLVLRKE